MTTFSPFSAYCRLRSTGGAAVGIPCKDEYIPAVLFTLSKTLPFSSLTSNILSGGHSSCQVIGNTVKHLSK